MKWCARHCVFVMLLFLPIAVSSQQQETSFTSRQFYAAALLSYNARQGYIDLDVPRQSVSVSKPGLLGFGLTGGARIPLNSFLRAQLGITADISKATDDTLFTAKPTLDEYFYYHGTLEPSLQCRLAPAWWTAVPFAVVGAGLNIVWVNERTFLINDQSQEILYTDRSYVNQASWSASAVAGLGVDVRLGKKLAITLVSTFRWLYPVFYDIKEDYPLYAMHYTETLLGNVTSLGLSFQM